MASPFLTPHSLLPAFEDGTDTWFRNVGILYIDAGEIPKRKYTIFKSRRKLEIYNTRYQFFQLFERTSRPADDKNCYAVKYCCRICDLMLDVYVTWVTVHHRCTATHQFILDIAPEHSEWTGVRVQSIALLQYVLANDQTQPKREGMLMSQLIYNLHTRVYLN